MTDTDPVADMREAAARIVEGQRRKLHERWSLDSAYLTQAIDGIRALPLPPPQHV